jgi:ATP-dependent DNA helicase RecG
VTHRDYPEFVIQEMTVNSVCHRAYSIKGTEIQIKMFDDRLVFESPGKLPGMVKPTNIRNTHFSRNPKIAAFLKAYHYVKEYGEGVDRIYRELEANGTSTLSFRTDDFILKITVPKVAEKVAEKVTVNGEKVAENQSEVAEKVAENQGKLTEKLIEKATSLGEKLTQNRIRILELMMEDPYISRADLAKMLGISETSIYRNIEAMRGKYLRRVGPDKGGFWEIIS